MTGDLLSLPADDPSKPVAERPRRVLGDVTPVAVPGGMVGGARAQSAYVFAPDRDGAPSLAWHLMAEGYRVMVATTPIEVDKATWPRGTYVVRVARNDATLPARINALARDAGVEVTAAASAFNETAQHGLGSESMVALTLPKIAIVGDDGISQTSYGALWFTLERRYGIRFTPIAMSQLGGDLSRFTAILLPSGNYAPHVSKDAVEHLKTWVRAGGTLVTMGGATEWAADESVALTSARKVADTEPAATTPPTAGAAAARPATTAATVGSIAADRLAEELVPYQSSSASLNTPESVPGIHVDALLDRMHWLTAGYDAPRLTGLLQGDLFELSKEGANVAVFPTTGPLVRAGFTWPNNTERLLRGTSLLIDEPIGGGHVVLFTNEPMFRGWWRSLDRLVLNALLLGAAY